MEDSFHREILEAHANTPLFCGTLDEFNYSGTWVSKKSGNSCKIQILIKGSIVSELAFTSEGSALSLACSSLMCCQVKEMSITKSIILARQIIDYVESGTEFVMPGDLVVYQTISRFPERHDCSLLSWRALIDTHSKA